MGARNGEARVVVPTRQPKYSSSATRFQTRFLESIPSSKAGLKFRTQESITNQSIPPAYVAWQAGTTKRVPYRLDSWATFKKVHKCANLLNAQLIHPQENGHHTGDQFWINEK